MACILHSIKFVYHITVAFKQMLQYLSHCAAFIALDLICVPLRSTYFMIYGIFITARSLFHRLKYVYHLAFSFAPDAICV